MNDTKRCPACFTDIDTRATRCPSCAQRQPDVTLHRDVPGRMFGGVAAALAQHFNWDVTLTRIVMVTSLAFTGGLVFWVYAAAWLMTPFAASGRAPMLKFVDSVGALFTPAKGSVENVHPE